MFSQKYFRLLLRIKQHAFFLSSSSLQSLVAIRIRFYGRVQNVFLQTVDRKTHLLVKESSFSPPTGVALTRFKKRTDRREKRDERTIAVASEILSARRVVSFLILLFFLSEEKEKVWERKEFCVYFRHRFVDDFLSRLFFSLALSLFTYSTYARAPSLVRFVWSSFASPSRSLALFYCTRVTFQPVR